MTEKDSRARFYVPDLAGGAEVALPPTEAHHAAHVLRLAPGAAVELFDGCGRAADAQIATVRRGDVTARVESVRGPVARAGPAVHLGFAVPKGSRLDWLLEKATELGAASLRPVRFERSVAGAGEFSESKREKWLAHAIAAAKQSGLDYLPTIEEPLPLEKFAAACGPGIYGDLASDARPIAEVLRGLAAGDEVNLPRGMVIVIGPEGGLTDAERAALRAGGFLPVRLGHTTLRIETAAVALVAAVIATSTHLHQVDTREPD
ncbi:MAG: RsmE family RNA methyltransferase [Planctomycetota bacterium]|nr:RsmE family RNA methyltransferase [Planctomycetota bacterium]